MTIIELTHAYNVLKKEKEEASESYDKAWEAWEKRLHQLPPVLVKTDEPLYIEFFKASQRLDKIEKTILAFEKKDWT